MIKDLAIEHSYYCSDTNYYSNDCSYYYDTWDDFISENGLPETDMDFNFCFRWDIRYDEDEHVFVMELFYMQQRHGKFVCYTIKEVKDSDEESIRNFLSQYWEYIKNLWLPINI